MPSNIEKMERLAKIAGEFDRLGLREEAQRIDAAMRREAGRAWDEIGSSLPGMETMEKNFRETAAYQSLGGTQTGDGSAYFGAGASKPLDLSQRPANMSPEQYMQWMMQNGGNVAAHGQQSGYAYMQALRSRYLQQLPLYDDWGRPISRDLYNASMQVPQGQGGGYQQAPQSPADYQPYTSQGSAHPGATNVPQYRQMLPLAQ